MELGEAQIRPRRVKIFAAFGGCLRRFDKLIGRSWTILRIRNREQANA